MIIDIEKRKTALCSALKNIAKLRNKNHNAGWLSDSVVSDGKDKEFRLSLK